MQRRDCTDILDHQILGLMSTQVIQDGEESKVAGFSHIMAIGNMPSSNRVAMRSLGECYLPIAQDQTQTELQVRASPNSLKSRIDQWG